MGCAERQRLEREHAEAGSTFHAALHALRNNIGTCPQEEYLRLDREADEAWNRMHRTRNALDGHLRNHNCMNQSSTAEQA